MSTHLSASSFVVGTLALGHYGWISELDSWSLGNFVLSSAGTFLIIAPWLMLLWSRLTRLPHLLLRGDWYRLGIFVVVFALLSIFFAVAIWISELDDPGPVTENAIKFRVFPAIGTALVSDVICLLVTMYALRKVAGASNAFTAAGFLLADALVAAVAFFVPWVTYSWVASGRGATDAYLLIAATANITTAAPSLVFVVVVATLLAHRLLWPTILRPFYNLIHAEKLTKPKLLGVAGLACFSVWIDVPEPVRSAFKGVLDAF